MRTFYPSIPIEWQFKNSGETSRSKPSKKGNTLGSSRGIRALTILWPSPTGKQPASKLHSGNSKAQSRDVQSNTTTNQSKRPFSSPTDMTQGSEISRLRDLNIDQADKDSLMEDAPEDSEPPVEPQPKRPAIGEGESPSSSMRARDSQSPPRRSKARPMSAQHNKKVESFDYKRDSKASPFQQQSVRPALAGRRIWNPETDAVPKQSNDTPNNRGTRTNPKKLIPPWPQASAVYWWENLILVPFSQCWRYP